MNMESRNLHHSITHWPNAGSDGYGGFTWGTPVLLSARWEEVSVNFKTPNGEEKVSNSIAYTLVNITVGDYLAEGDLTATTDPTTISNTWEVKQFTRNTDLRNLSTQRKSFM